MPDPLKLTHLREALTGTATAFRRRLRLLPAGGPGDKVFPPTYVGAVYATEERRIDGEVKECVVLDSVQSQANRMEEALQQAVDERRLELPLVVVDFSDAQGLLDEVGRITSLEAPHRIADAIIRDSELGGVPFRDSEVGKPLDQVSIRNATALYRLSPTSLVLGMWDSHGPKGGLGAKFERTIASEIIAVDVNYGLRTGGRIDPLGIQTNAGPVYRAKDGGWTLDEDDAATEKGGKPQKVGAHGEGKPSEVGHGNVAPGFGKYQSNVRIRDPLRPDQDVRRNAVAPGGITMEYALQTTVLSLPALRRLRFPVDGSSDPELELAARTTLAALGLCMATLSAERGFDLRSRCVLHPEDTPLWELIDRPGEDPSTYGLAGPQALSLLEDAVSAAREAGLDWRTDPVVLQPSTQLVELVRRSQELAAQKRGVEEEEA